MQGNNSWLWNYSVVRPIRKNVVLVRNNFTGQLMIRRVLPYDCFQVMCALVTIRHQNLMAVYDCVVDSGVCVSLCEFVSGYTLDSYVESRGAFKAGEAKNILCQICDGLEVLHKNGIVHRDIKPENIMLDSTGLVKIIDYSITRIIKPDMRQDTAVLGTAGYASPEQFGFKQTSGKADIYACGVLLNYLLTGRLPNEQMYQGALASVIETCIEIDEDKRFDSVKELKAVLTGKKKNLHRRFRPLPGFRSKHIFPKIVTTLGIILWLIMLICYIVIFTSLIDYSTYRTEYLIDQIQLCAVIMLFWSLLPYLFFGDVFRLSEKISPDNPQNGKYILVIMGVASIMTGALLLLL